MQCNYSYAWYKICIWSEHTQTLKRSGIFHGTDTEHFQMPCDYDKESGHRLSMLWDSQPFSYTLLEFFE